MQKKKEGRGTIQAGDHCQSAHSQHQPKEGADGTTKEDKEGDGELKEEHDAGREDRHTCQSLCRVSSEQYQDPHSGSWGSHG